jgi:hypothetical protein
LPPSPSAGGRPTIPVADQVEAILTLLEADAPFLKAEHGEGIAIQTRVNEQLLLSEVLD